MQKPSIGRVVIVSLSEDQLAQIPNRNNGSRECPATIVRVFDDGKINVQCQLDSSSTLWLTSLTCGDGPGQWQWPKIIPPHVSSSTDPKY